MVGIITLGVLSKAILLIPFMLLGLFLGMKSGSVLDEMALKLHLPNDFFYGEQKMDTLSGGEKVKVQIARILMGEPSVLFLDEPSNDIDIETLEWLERTIRDTDKAVLYISHDETLIERTANVIIHIEHIRRKTVSRYTVARMTYRQYMDERQGHLTKQKQVALNDRREAKIRDEKHNRIRQSVEHNLNTISRQDPAGARLLKKKMKAVKSLEKRYEREKENMMQMPDSEDGIFFKFGEDIKIPSGKVILEISLDKISAPHIDGQEARVLARNIFLRVKGPEKICIIGKNGIGKTTLLRLIKDELIERKDIHISYMPQNYEDLLDMNKTPVEYLTVTGNKEEITRIRTYLGSMKYTSDEMSHSIAELSGGQKAKILLLKMSLSGSEVLILDEPTRNFSPLSGPVIREVLSAYQGVIISISHDRKYIKEVCNCVYQLTHEGLIKEEY